MTVLSKHLKNFSPKENNCLSNIYEIINGRESMDHLMVSVYLIKKDCFLYFSKTFIESFGINYKKILKEGWNYWFSQVHLKESLVVKNRINNFLVAPFQRDSCVLKYHVTNSQNDIISMKHEILLHKIDKEVFAISYFFDVTAKDKLEHYFDMVDNHEAQNVKKNKMEIISPREKEVLMLVADGFSSKQIADKLFISNHTAISHRKNLIEKFKVRNTAQLIKKASRRLEFW